MQGLRGAGGGGGGGGGPPPPPPPPFFEKKIKKYTISNKRNFCWNRNIRLANIAEASKYTIGPFRSYIISGEPQNEYLYKAALSRRLLRFHLPSDSIYTNNDVFFLSRFLNNHGATLS